MDRATAEKILDGSLARGSNTPIPAGSDASEYLEAHAHRLRRAAIDPVEVKITDACFEKEWAEGLKEKKVYGIAKDDDHWLLFIEETGEFALAFGASPLSLNLLGFSSTDALAEWLG